jgi:hypothetical protein
MTKNMMCQYQLDVLRQRALMACCKAHEGGFQRLRNPDLGEVADALFHLGGFRLRCAKHGPIYIWAQRFTANFPYSDFFNGRAIFGRYPALTGRPKVHRLVWDTDHLGQLFSATGQSDGGLYVFHPSILHM